MKTVLFAAVAISLAVPSLSLAATHRHHHAVAHHAVSRHAVTHHGAVHRVATRSAPSHRAAPLTAKTAAGSWSLSGGSKACSVKLNDKKASIDVPAACLKAYPRLKDARSWKVADGPAIEILNPGRQRIYRFEKGSDGAFTTAANRDGDVFTLARGAASKDAPDTADGSKAAKADAAKLAKAKAMTPKERMSGGWSLTAEDGGAACHFTSTSNTAGTEGKLSVKKGCAKAFRLPYASWTQKHNRLELLDVKGKVLTTLRHSDPTSWKGQNKAGKTIYFSRD